MDFRSQEKLIYFQTVPNFSPLCHRFVFGGFQVSVKFLFGRFLYRTLPACLAPHPNLVYNLFWGEKTSAFLPLPLTRFITASVQV